MSEARGAERDVGSRPLPSYYGDRPGPAGQEPGRVGPTPALRVRGLRKRFGDHEAVAGIDLELPAGRFIGLVGPNGAGKTTTLSMVTGLLRPDDGPGPDRRPRCVERPGRP